VEKLTASPGLRRWIWQSVSLTGFALLNVVGLPLLAGTVLTLGSSRFRRRYGLVGWALGAMTLLSIALAVVVKTDYDNYSLGGQLLLHTRWYLFPLHPFALWLVYRALRRRGLPTAVLAVGAGAAALVLLAVRFGSPPSPWWTVMMPQHQATLTQDEWLTLRCLHDRAPAVAVILTNRDVDKYRFVLSGMSGRAAYLEMAGNPVDGWAQKLNPRDDRLQRIRDLWSLTDPGRFQQLLRETPADLLLEYADAPLRVEGRPGLTRLWESPHRQVTVWRIDH
jgi:hypothetical protein